jgi:hypothetical protein
MRNPIIVQSNLQSSSEVSDGGGVGRLPGARFVIIPVLVGAAVLVPPQTIFDTRVHPSYVTAGTRGTPRIGDRDCSISGR